MTKTPELTGWLILAALMLIALTRSDNLWQKALSWLGE